MTAVIGAAQSILRANGYMPAWLPRGADGNPATIFANYLTGAFWHKGPKNDNTAFKASASGVFTRTTTKSYLNSSAARVTAAINAEAFDFSAAAVALGLSTEPSRTNIVLNSATLVTQNCTVTAQAYTLSFEGTGSVALTGAFAGSLVGTGTGVGSRVTLTFTPTAGTLTLTPTGSVTNAQLEASTFATSYIPTTGAALTRAQDFLTFGPVEVPGAQELVVNGDFSSGTSNWTPVTIDGTGTMPTLAVVGGQLQVTSNGNFGGASQAFATDIGTAYVLTVGAFGGSNFLAVISNTAGGAVQIAGATTSPITFVATAATTYVILRRHNSTAGVVTFDNISIKKALPFVGYNQTRGAFLWEGQNDQTNLTATSSAVFNFDDGTPNNVINAIFGGGETIRIGITAGGVLQAAFVANVTVTTGIRHRVLLLWENNRVECWVDGVQIGVTDTLATIPAVTNLKLGRRYDGGTPLAGHIAQLAYFDNPPWGRAAALSAIGGA